VLRPFAGREGAIAGAVLAGGMLGGLEMRRWWWVFDGAGPRLALAIVIAWLIDLFDSQAYHESNH
jgi:hypothetical protein